MILPLLLLLQQGTPLPPPNVVTVKGLERSVVIPVVSTTAGLAVAAKPLALALGGTAQAMPNGHFTLEIAGARFDLTEQVPFARLRDDVIPLASAPFVEDGALYVPLQFVSEVLPRKASGVFYDAQRAELRVFGAVGPKPTVPAHRARGRTSAGRIESGSSAQPVARRGPGAQRRLVVVDAGHGGPDRGMTGPLGSIAFLQEKDVTLAVARRVAAELRSRGIDVLLTRNSDTLIALSDRGRMANASHADLFLSIHVNAANPNWKQPAGARGFETYFLSEAKTEDESRVERMENEAVRFETVANVQKGDPLSFIINDMAQNEHLRESLDFAESIQRRMGTIHPGPNRGVKQANFAVLRTSFMPAVLVELGFGTNADEATYLLDSGRQASIAAAIAAATDEYLARYERRVTAGSGS